MTHLTPYLQNFLRMPQAGHVCQMIKTQMIGYLCQLNSEEAMYIQYTFSVVPIILWKGGRAPFLRLLTLVEVVKTRGRRSVQACLIAVGVD